MFNFYMCDADVQPGTSRPGHVPGNFDVCDEDEQFATNCPGDVPGNFDMCARHVPNNLRKTMMQMDSLLQAAPDTCRAMIGILETEKWQYRGFCRAGDADGCGELKKANGETYLGDWREGQYHGQGTLVKPHGSTYKGEWCMGKRHGKGYYKSVGHFTYKGDFLDDKLHGKGTAKWGKYVYEGDFVKDLRHGVGRMTKRNGESYFGPWRRGRKYGEGTMTYPDGREVVGCFAPAYGQIGLERDWEKGIYG